MIRNPRMKQIMGILLQEDRVMTLQELALKAGLGRRTIQRELENVNRYLKEYGITFVSRTGVGIWLEGSSDAKQLLLHELMQGDVYDAGNREERRKRLILEILKGKGLKKLFYYSSTFGVCEATIGTDLDAVEEWLGKYDLKVIRKPGSGVEIKGSEEDYRRAIRGFIRENMNTELLAETYEAAEGKGFGCEQLCQSKIGQLLRQDILKRVEECILGMEDARIRSLTETSYAGLVIHIAIAINRIENHAVIEEKKLWTEEIEQDEDYALAQRIAAELEAEFETELPEVEIAYICLHIKGAKHEKIVWNGSKTELLKNHELQQLISRMIDAFDLDKAYLLKQDEEFIQGLLAHLQPTFIRILYDMQIVNPVLEEIKTSYADYFRKCQGVARVMEAWIGKKIPEPEVGFLAIHFGAAMVRLEARQEKLRKVQVGIVCSSGIGISQMMSSKIGKTFGGRVQISTFGKMDLTALEAGRMDFLVSSIPLEIPDTEILYVNPLLSEQDMEAVGRKIMQYERMSPKQPGKAAASREMDGRGQAAARIHLIVNQMEILYVKPDITFEALLAFIGAKFAASGDLAEKVREDLWNRERKGSQIFAEFGFALFHAKTEGVSVPGFHACKAQGAQQFTDPYFKNIKIAFIMLLPADENVQINGEILGDISAMLVEDWTFTETVLKGNKEEIRKMLAERLAKLLDKK